MSAVNDMRAYGLIAVVLLAGCGGPAKEPTPKKAAAPPVVIDESRRFPSKDRVRIELVEQKLLGKDFMPGGNLAEYSRNGKTYQQFLVRAASPEKAALLMFDFQNTLRDPKFIAHMGGYFGFDGSKPVYLFQKGVFFTGYIGLPEREAETLAREFAMRLN